MMKNKKLSAIASLAVLGLSLSACGGGGSESVSGTTTNTTTTPLPAAQSRATDAVSLVISQSPSGGVVPSGAAKDVTVTYTGSASVGELMQVSVNFAKNTYSWQVVQSSYGIAGQTGNGTLAVASSGGYTMSGGGSLFLTQAGSIQVNGLMLNIGGTSRSAAVSAQPQASTAPVLADMAGTYAFGLFAHDAGVKPPYTTTTASIGWGTAKINADGTGRLCPATSAYSDSCVNAETNAPITLTVKAGDSHCTTANNLFGIYMTQSSNTEFAGCAVLSSNGSGNVVYLDKQAGTNIDPGFITMVQLPTSALTVQDGAYSETTIADLAVSPSNDCVSLFHFSGGSMTAQCMNNGTLQTQTFGVKSQSPMPAGVLGIVSSGTASPMLLQLAADAWLHVAPTKSFSGTDSSEPGSAGLFKRAGS